MFKVDSSIYVDSLKFKTVGGRSVYGGGGISPDVFVPLDTSGTGLYYSSLLWSGAISQFAFDYVKKNRYFEDNPWTSLSRYKNEFKAGKSLINELIEYAGSELGILPFTKSEISHCEAKLLIHLKAEIARQIWQENGFFSIYNEHDAEFLGALRSF